MLGPDEHALLSGKRGSTRLGFAVLVRFVAFHGRFPTPEEIDGDAIEYVASQVEVPGRRYWDYYHRGRTKPHRNVRVLSDAWSIGVGVPW